MMYILEGANKELVKLVQKVGSCQEQPEEWMGEADKIMRQSQDAAEGKNEISCV